MLANSCRHHALLPRRTSALMQWGQAHVVHKRACLEQRAKQGGRARRGASMFAPSLSAPDRSQEAPNAVANNSSTSSQTSSSTPEASTSFKQEAQLSLEQYKEIYDRLINIFQTRPREDWKKLVVFSKQWKQHKQGVYDRIKELADLETNVDKKLALRKMVRTLQGVSDEVERYNVIVQKFETAAQDEWDAIVATYRGDMQTGFFEHMQCLIAGAKDDQAKQEELILMNTRFMALISSHDSVTSDKDALARAAEVYRDLLSSITSLEDAEKKMSELASAGKIDPAFLQISAKAYGAARETEMRLDEAKWVAYKLYRNARDIFERQQPKERRIIEYLLTIRDPQERINQLDAAVTPGPEYLTEQRDYLWTTPQRLFQVVDGTLQAYEAMKQGAKDQYNMGGMTIMPSKVKAMMEIRQLLIKRYL